MYFAHHAALALYQYRPNFPGEVRDSATLVDRVPIFRRLGERAFINQLRKQRSTLLQYLDHLPRLSKLSDDTEFVEAEACVKKTVRLITQLGAAWSDVLARRIFERTMGHLVDCVLAHFLKLVLDESELSTAVAHHTAYLLKLLIGCERVLQGSTILQLAEGSSSSGSNDTLKRPTKDIVPHFLQAKAVLSTLEQSIGHVKHDIEAGIYREAGFNKEQLVKLVTSVFPPSDARSSLVERVVG